MEGQQGIETIVVLGTAILLFIVVFVIVFLINFRRNLYVKKTLIELYENKYLKELNKSNETIKKLEKRIEILENKLKQKSEET